MPNVNLDTGEVYIEDAAERDAYDDLMDALMVHWGPEEDLTWFAAFREDDHATVVFFETPGEVHYSLQPSAGFMAPYEFTIWENNKERTMAYGSTPVILASGLATILGLGFNFDAENPAVFTRLMATQPAPKGVPDEPLLPVK